MTEFEKTMHKTMDDVSKGMTEFEETMRETMDNISRGLTKFEKTMHEMLDNIERQMITNKDLFYWAVFIIVGTVFGTLCMRLLGII